MKEFLQEAQGGTMNGEFHYTLVVALIAIIGTITMSIMLGGRPPS